MSGTKRAFGDVLEENYPGEGRKNWSEQDLEKFASLYYQNLSTKEMVIELNRQGVSCNSEQVKSKKQHFKAKTSTSEIKKLRLELAHYKEAVSMSRQIVELNRLLCRARSVEKDLMAMKENIDPNRC